MDFSREYRLDPVTSFSFNHKSSARDRRWDIIDKIDDGKFDLKKPLLDQMDHDEYFALMAMRGKHTPPPLERFRKDEDKAAKLLKDLLLRHALATARTRSRGHYHLAEVDILRQVWLELCLLPKGFGLGNLEVAFRMNAAVVLGCDGFNRHCIRKGYSFHKIVPAFELRMSVLYSEYGQMRFSWSHKGDPFLIEGMAAIDVLPVGGHFVPTHTRCVFHDDAHVYSLRLNFVL